MPVYCGHVYILYLPIAAKEKLLVPAYIQPDDKVRFFVINTERTEFQLNKPELANHVLALNKNADSRFLTHDSWLVCNEVVGGWTTAEINARNGCYRGSLDELTIIAVKELIKESRFYSEKEKTAILNQWP